MLFEYAVEPKAIGSSWQNFRYLIEKFGFDRGRLISRFPRRWEREVIEAAQESGMKDVRLKSLVEKLHKAKTEALIASGRIYDPSVGDWLDNTLRQQAIKPFHAIIASELRGAHDIILVAEEIDDAHPLMVSPHNWEVDRVGVTLAAAMAPLLRSASAVLFVDRFFDIREARYKETLKACLAVIAERGANGVRCEIHFADHDTRPSAEIVEREARRWLGNVVPNGMSIVLYSWRERTEGADFHARYLLTDRGGMNIEAGFSAEGTQQKVDITLLDSTMCQVKRESFRRGANTYELVEPVLEIFWDGRVVRI